MSKPSEGSSLDFAGVIKLKCMTAIVTLLACVPLSVVFWLVSWSEEDTSVTVDVDTEMRNYFFSLFTPSFLLWIASLSSYVLLSKVSALSHSVAKITERMILILVAIHIFKTAVSSKNMVGIFTAFVGISAFYSQTSKKEKLKPLSANEKSGMVNGIVLVDIINNGDEHGRKCSVHDKGAV